jgi:hypothetical protein
LGFVVGGAETAIGTGGVAIEGMASVTGVGGSVGVPLTGGSVAVATHGVSMSTKAVLGMGKSASEFWHMFANHNGTKGTGNATHPKQSKSPEGTGKPNISQKHDEIAHDGYYGRKQERTNEYNTPIADRNEIVGGNTNGYRLTEPIKWMESMGMIQIKKKIVD